MVHLPLQSFWIIYKWQWLASKCQSQKCKKNWLIPALCDVFDNWTALTHLYSVLIKETDKQWGLYRNISLNGNVSWKWDERFPLILSIFVHWCIVSISEYHYLHLTIVLSDCRNGLGSIYHHCGDGWSHFVNEKQESMHAIYFLP